MSALTNPESLELSGGAGSVDGDDPCLMTKAALVHAHRHGYLNQDSLKSVFRDDPCWSDPIIRPMVVWCNDSLAPNDVGSWEALDALMPQVLNATKITDPITERRVHARVLCAQARKVLDLAFPEDRGVCEAAIAIREAWLVGDATEQECKITAVEAAEAAKAAEAAWVGGAAEAAKAAEAAWAAVAAEAAWAAVAAEAAEIPTGAARVQYLQEFLDLYEKARAEEGVMLDDGWVQALKDQGFAIDATSL